MPGSRLSIDGTELKQLRKSAGYTQEQLAEKLDLSRETIVAIENNRPSALRGLTFANLLKWKEVCCSQADTLTYHRFTRYLQQLLNL